MAEMHDVMQALGHLQACVDGLRRDFTDEAHGAAESRAAVHRRLDAQAEAIGVLRKDFEVAAVVNAQLRTDLKTHVASVEQSVAEWKRMKTLGSGVVGLLAIGGLSVGATLVWAGEAVKHWMKAWMG